MMKPRGNERSVFQVRHYAFLTESHILVDTYLVSGAKSIKSSDLNAYQQEENTFDRVALSTQSIVGCVTLFSQYIFLILWNPLITNHCVP